jgi:hypothetical protein
LRARPSLSRFEGSCRYCTAKRTEVIIHAEGGTPAPCSPPTGHPQPLLIDLNGTGGSIKERRRNRVGAVTFGLGTIWFCLSEDALIRNFR